MSTNYEAGYCGQIGFKVTSIMVVHMYGSERLRNGHDRDLRHLSKPLIGLVQ